jgi:hypothetical protein
MVIGVPEQQTLRIAAMRAIGERRFGGITEDIFAADRLVVTEQDIALPFAHEHALGRAAFVARVRVDLPPAPSGPAHDLHCVALYVVDEAAVSLQSLLRRVNHGHAHACKAGGQPRVQVIEDGHAGAAAGSPRQGWQSATRRAVTTSSRVRPLRTVCVSRR